MRRQLKKAVVFLFILKKFCHGILKYGLGIDIVMEKLDACISIIDKLQHVMIRIQCSFDNYKKGFAAFVLSVAKNTKLPIPAVYLMEATGIYYEQLAWFLHNKNCSVSVVLPNKAKKYKEALGLINKVSSLPAVISLAEI